MPQRKCPACADMMYNGSMRKDTSPQSVRGIRSPAFSIAVGLFIVAAMGLCAHLVVYWIVFSGRSWPRVFHTQIAVALGAIGLAALLLLFPECRGNAGLRPPDATKLRRKKDRERFLRKSSESSTPGRWRRRRGASGSSTARLFSDSRRVTNLQSSLFINPRYH